MQIPQLVSEEPNGGNGHSKPFTLAPVKSPEEIAEEHLRKIAPEIRRAVAEINGLGMPAKGFFSAILDYTFMYRYGGSGRGKLFASVKDLSAWLHHDKDSITAWRDQLEQRGLIWTRDGWPKSEWRICALCPAPAQRGTEYQSIMGKAAGDGQEQSGNLPLSHLNSISPGKTDVSGRSEGTESPHKAEIFRRGRGNCPLHEGKVSPDRGGNHPQGQGKPSAGPGESIPKSQGKPSAGVADTFPHTKESPVENRRIGDKEGGRHSPPPATQVQEEVELENWRKTLQDMFPSKRDKLMERLKGQLSQETAQNVRTFLKRKIAILRSFIDGPTPAPVEMAPSASVGPKQKPVAPEVIVALAQRMKQAVCDSRA